MRTEYRNGDEITLVHCGCDSLYMQMRAYLEGMQTC